MNKFWKELAIARYRCLSNNFILCVNNWEGKPLDAIEEIKKETEIGKYLVRVEKEYLQSFKTRGLWEN